MDRRPSTTLNRSVGKSCRRTVSTACAVPRCSQTRYCILWVFVILCSVLCQAQNGVVPADEPVDTIFLQRTAQEYYDALVAGRFDKTAEREVFSLPPRPDTVDMAAYSKAMQKHPYVGKERIAVTVKDIDPVRAYLDLTIYSNEGVTTNRATWSRTGTPLKWIAQITQMTMAGMPGYDIISFDGDDRENTTPKVRSKIVFKERNLQDGTITSDTNAPVRFVRPPKVMPTKVPGKKAYVMGFIKNLSPNPVTGVRVTVTVKSEDGSMLETQVFRPGKLSLAPGAKVMFSGNLDHLDPKRTEFSLDWNH